MKQTNQAKVNSINGEKKQILKILCSNNMVSNIDKESLSIVFNFC